MTNPMRNRPPTAAKAIPARIRAFTRDYQQWNQEFYHKLDGLNWEAPRKAFRKLAAEHLVSLPPIGRGPGSSIGWPAEHSPEEKIVSINELTENVAIVETELSRGGLSQYYEYTLRKLRLQWRISDVQVFCFNKAAKAIDVDLRRLARRPLAPIIAKEFPVGLDRLFEHPVGMLTSLGPVGPRIVSVGRITSPSGFLAGDDPGAWGFGTAVFEMPIPVGSHEIQLVSDDRFGIVGAARIMFGPRKTAASYVCATRRLAGQRRSPRSHWINVDGGMIGLVDAATIFTLSCRERERVYKRLCNALRIERAKGAASIPLHDSVSAWAISSGCGDGGYAAYWELARDGRPLSLIFDFADLGLPIWETRRIPLSIRKWLGKVEDATLRAWGISIYLGVEAGQQFLKVKSGKPTRIKLFDSNGQTLFDSAGHGSYVCENVTTYVVQPFFRSGMEIELEVQIFVGHRYERTGR